MTQSSLKLGYLAYSSYVLKHYWKHLKNKFDSSWAVSDCRLLDELIEQGVPRDVISFKDSLINIPGSPFLKKSVNFLTSQILRNPHTIESQLIKKAKVDTWIADSTLPLLRQKVKKPKILVFHSVTFKRYILIPETLQYDLILLPGKYHYDEFHKRFPQTRSAQLRMVGWPPHDDLIAKSYPREQLLKNMGLNPAQKTILYAPTHDSFPKGKLFPNAFPGNSETIQVLGKYLKANKLNMIIKLHASSFEIIKNEELRRFAETNGIAWNARSGAIEDPNQFLAVSDALISDSSGIFMQYLILNRPMIFVTPDKPGVWETSDVSKEWRPGPVVNRLDELFKSIDHAVQNPMKHAEERRELLDRIFYKPDGNSGQRAAESVQEFLDDLAVKF